MLGLIKNNIPEFLFKGAFMLLFFIGTETSTAQTNYSMEYLVGKTSAANSFFPELDMNQTMSFSIGKKFTETDWNWIQKLNNPTVGLNFEYADYGNREVLGRSYSVLPFLEVPIFKSKIKNLNLNTGIGMSYFTKKFQESSNWQNKAVSTDVTWAFRMFLYYKLVSGSNLNTRLSLGYTHKSNGHTRWPNNGLNSFLMGLNFQFEKPNVIESKEPLTKERISYFTIESGLGRQSLSRLYNANKGVYGAGFSYGQIYDNTYKLGLGFYYRFYQGYYDYIKDEGLFVNDAYPELKKNAFYNASTYGVNVSAEILMNHVGIVTELGLNIDKPFYKIDYRINNETYIDGNYYPGETDTKYWIKRFVSGKMGLKYYLWNTKNKPKNNLSIGALICSNLGQADYSELNIGFIHLLK